jgi:rhomboid protease GluP
MALFAAIYTASFHFGATAARTKLQTNALGILVPSLIPLGVSAAGGRVDFGAHLGGAATGLLLGLLILKVWRRNDMLPGLRVPATLFAAAGWLGFALCILPIAQDYRTFALASKLIPPDQVPKTDGDAVARSSELVSQYPEDPRAHYFRAIALIRARDNAGAERELRAALAEEEVIRLMFTPALAANVRGVLAAVLSEGKTDEAKVTAAPACASPDLAATIRSALDKVHLCDKPAK